VQRLLGHRRTHIGSGCRVAWRPLSRATRAGPYLHVVTNGGNLALHTRRTYQPGALPAAAVAQIGILAPP
jgi:hypothetical protein